MALSLTSKHTPTAWMISASIPNPVPESGHFKGALPGHFWQAPKQDQEAIDQLVVSQASDESAWEAPVRVKRSKPAALSLRGELAARAAFLAKLHREPGMDGWVERVVRERVELEEFASKAKKKKLAS